MTTQNGLNQMKLYYIPGACSLAVDIAMRKAGLSPELSRLDPATGKTEHGDVLKETYPKGYVPVVIDDEGDVLTEVVSTLIELDARYPQANLLPVDKKDRRRAIEWLAFTSAELHRQYVVPMFMDVPQTDDIQAARAKVEMRFGHVADAMTGSKPFLFGDDATAADFYLFVVMFWTTPAKVNLDQYPQLVAYRDRMMQLPYVAEAMKAEGLM